MKAKKMNIVNLNRNKLEEVIPLNTPYTIAIDPSNMCNFKCKFCAIQNTNEKLEFKKQCMDIKLFNKIVKDISEFDDKLKVLRISGQGEPLVNKDICEMIKFAKSEDIADWIEIVTNGSLLNPELNSQLVSSGVDRIRISIEAVDEKGYIDIASVKIDFKNFIKNMEDLYVKSRGKCEIYIKTVDVAVEKEEAEQAFYDIFGNICDRIFIDNIIPLWSDYDELEEIFTLNNKKGLHGQGIKNISVCTYPFYSLLINPDGEVTMCCADWKREYVLGDLKIEKLKDIWNGEKLRSFWIDNLNSNKGKYSMCNKCSLPEYDCQDNIDNFRNEILKNLEKK